MPFGIDTSGNQAGKITDMQDDRRTSFRATNGMDADNELQGIYRDDTYRLPVTDGSAAS